MGNLFCMPSPWALDHADHRLPAGMHIDVFDRDFLLALLAAAAWHPLFSPSVMISVLGQFLQMEDVIPGVTLVRWGGKKHNYETEQK
jgi:hypothetical protein